ncbi:phosphoribosylaminoimidazole-succinocarboxamide synthase [Hysterangium stoloniferum]|nr:phosphoribosylaminoimidazole-succinocarboxamide synthase [Hysterangium stoloniferum]
MTSTTLLESRLPTLNLVSKGKVRDIYTTSDRSVLLFVASDRISAYDVILKNGIPGKGKLLNKISAFWFEKLKDIIPNHVVTTDVAFMPEEIKAYSDQLEGRSMLVKKAKVIPLEAIVRGYITGSAWAEYKKSGTVHGMPMSSGLVESQKFPEPIFTPSTKAPEGQHDENISHKQAENLIGPELYAEISSTAIKLYTEASYYAESRGLILADTKFEFGLMEDGSGSRKLILIDELLTPDSSRYWPYDGYKPGVPQPSFDKQYVRDWLTSAGFKKGFESGPPGKEGEGWIIDDAIVEGTKKRYQEAVERLMG